MKWPLVSGLLLLYSFAHSAESQQCSQTIMATAPASFFKIQANGTILDKRNKLIWMRCSVGQVWEEDKQRCSGKARLMNWNSAQKMAKQLGHSWRLPSIKELSLLVESRCESPSINLRLFPNTPAGHFWTNTAFVNLASTYWLVQFQFGENHVDRASRLALLRLVKDP